MFVFHQGNINSGVNTGKFYISALGKNLTMPVNERVNHLSAERALELYYIEVSSLANI